MLFDMILSSWPFGDQYEYSCAYNDFGHNPGNKKFWEQMDYLTPNLYKVLKPGRIIATHIKDRIRYGHQTKHGFMAIERVSDHCGDHLEKHGFIPFGRITIVTDVVRENSSTYRLGWSENANDSSKMGVGLPEYVLLFRKPPSDNQDQRSDEPVKKLKPDHYVCSGCGYQTNSVEKLESLDYGECLCPTCGAYRVFDPVEDYERGYSKGRWQIDAHSFWRSNGNRPLTPEEAYDYEAHVKRQEEKERNGNLPSSHFHEPPTSDNPFVWTGVNFMTGLNGKQRQRQLQNHTCLARNSLILTKELGYIPIQDVSVGNHVLTHKGRWRPVLVVQNTGVQQAITIKAHGVPGLTLTPEHKVWCRKPIRVREREGAEYVAPIWVEAENTLRSYVNLKLPDTEIQPVTNPLHWWVAGRWIADGHWDMRGSAIISCGDHELDDLLLQLGEYAGGVHGNGTSLQVRLLDRNGDIKRILEKCGHGADGKHLPPEAFTLPVELASALLSGYLSGDGYFLADRERWMASSVSRCLLLGVAMLVQRVHGSIASVYAGRPAREAVIEGRTVQCKQDWVLSFDALPEGRRQKPFILNDGAWKKISSVEDAEMVETWNLRVAEDESYTAEGCIVKNCPLPFDIVNRLIRRFTNEGDVILEPFAGLFTVPYCAIKLGRKAYGIELSDQYFEDGLKYCKEADLLAQQPALFDLMVLSQAA